MTIIRCETKRCEHNKRGVCMEEVIIMDDFRECMTFVEGEE